MPTYKFSKHLQNYHQFSEGQDVIVTATGPTACIGHKAKVVDTSDPNYIGILTEDGGEYCVSPAALRLA